MNRSKYWAQRYKELRKSTPGQMNEWENKYDHNYNKCMKILVDRLKKVRAKPKNITDAEKGKWPIKAVEKRIDDDFLRIVNKQINTTFKIDHEIFPADDFMQIANDVCEIIAFRDQW